MTAPPYPYDAELAKKTFDHHRSIGACTPLKSPWKDGIPSWVPQVDLTLTPEQIAKAVSSQIPLPLTLAKKNNAGSASGLGQKEAAFIRALAARGFDTSNPSKITKGAFIVSFGKEEWTLSKEGTEIHKQPYAAGSIKVVERKAR